MALEIGLEDVCAFLQRSSVVPTLSSVSRLLSRLNRIDFIKELPIELSLRVLSFLDARSLTDCAKVSHAWKEIADDDRLWYRMCLQHIDRQCEVCGWGLPVLHHHAVLLKGHANCCPNQKVKRKRDEIDALAGEIPPFVKSGWKQVYAERLVVEQNWRAGRSKLTTLPGHSDAVNCVCVNLDHPKFPLLATGSNDNLIKLWNLDTYECVNTLVGHSGWVWAIQLDNVKLVSASADKTLKIWQLNTGRCIRTLQGHRDQVTCLNFSYTPNPILISGSADWTIRLWDTTAGRASLLTGHTDWVNDVRIVPCLPDNWQLSKNSRFSSAKCRYAVSASDDCTIRVWNLDEKACLFTLSGHVGPVYSLDCRYVPLTGSMSSGFRITGVSANNQARLVLVSGSGDNTLKLWDLDAKSCTNTLFGHVESVWNVKFDSLRIASVSQDGQLKLWNFQGKCVQTFPKDQGEQLTPIHALSMTDTMLLTGDTLANIKVYDFNSHEG